MHQRLKKELATRKKGGPLNGDEPSTLNYDEFPCPFCREPIKRSSAFCDLCGRDLAGLEPEFAPSPFERLRHEAIAERVAHKTEDHSHFTSYITTFSTILILAGVIWVGIVPFVKAIKQPAAIELGWLVAAVAVPMLMFALIVVAFSMPAQAKPRTDNSSMPPLATVIAIASLAVVIYAFHAPFSMAVYLVSAGAFGGLVSLALGNRVFAITAILISVVGFLAVHELQATASGSLNMIDQLQQLNLGN